MHAVLIDPFNRTVTDVETDGGYREITRLIKADMIDVIRADSDIDIYIDDNGLANPDQAYWRIDGTAQSHLAGYGLMLGHTRDGESAPCPHKAALVARVIEWVDPPSDEQMDKLTTITVTPF